MSVTVNLPSLKRRVDFMTGPGADRALLQMGNLTKIELLRSWGAGRDMSGRALPSLSEGYKVWKDSKTGRGSVRDFNVSGNLWGAFHPRRLKRWAIGLAFRGVRENAKAEGNLKHAPTMFDVSERHKTKMVRYFADQMRKP
jgi:hypothetical protein